MDDYVVVEKSKLATHKFELVVYFDANDILTGPSDMQEVMVVLHKGASDILKKTSRIAELVAYRVLISEVKKNGNP